MQYIYNADQLQKDLSLIVTVFGERRQVGFYTYGVFDYGCFNSKNLKLEDQYISTPKILLEGKTIFPGELETQTELAETIMLLAMKAEEIMEMRYGRRV